MEFMNPLYALVVPVTVLAAYDPEHYSFWDRMAERWGIGLVGLAACFIIARWTMRREEYREAKKEEKEKEEKAERERKEKEWNDERKALLAENNRLMQEQLTQSQASSTKLELLIKDQTKANNDQAMEMKNLARRMIGKPCVMQAPQETEG